MVPAPRRNRYSNADRTRRRPRTRREIQRTFATVALARREAGRKQTTPAPRISKPGVFYMTTEERKQFCPGCGGETSLRVLPSGEWYCADGLCKTDEHRTRVILEALPELRTQAEP